MVKVLIVDDAQFMRNILKKIFTSNTYDVIGEADTADAGVQAFKKLKPDIVTMDICMPNKSGIEAIKDIIKADKTAKILVCSALGQELLVMEAIQAGAKDFIVKPFKKEKIIETIEKVLASK
jgi:two-component system, chemotaxis family, chemotaxis protein CheY